MVLGTGGEGGAGGSILRTASDIGDVGTPSDSSSPKYSCKVGYMSFLVFLFLFESTLSFWKVIS